MEFKKEKEKDEGVWNSKKEKEKMNVYCSLLYKKIK
jgi:hypothetical protein